MAAFYNLDHWYTSGKVPELPFSDSFCCYLVHISQYSRQKTRAETSQTYEKKTKLETQGAVPIKLIASTSDVDNDVNDENNANENHHGARDARFLLCWFPLAPISPTKVGDIMALFVYFGQLPKLSKMSD